MNRFIRQNQPTIKARKTDIYKEKNINYYLFYFKHTVNKYFKHSYKNLKCGLITVLIDPQCCHNLSLIHTRCLAVARIADCTASQHLWGSREVIHYVTIW